MKEQQQLIDLPNISLFLPLSESLSHRERESERIGK